MAATKDFVILFLVYLSFEISPLNSAAIPERLDASDSVVENEESVTESSDNYSTTGDDDIGKIFETYENLYIKNSNWFNDDELLRNENSGKSLEIKSEDETTLSDLEIKSEDETTLSDLEPTEQTEPTADDVVETIHNIIDEKIDTKNNRTDRTIVVVVTTNVFNINGSDDSSKRQHTLLSFGTPGMFQKETSTDATLAMHNKITSEFFNSNPSPINEQSGTTKTNDLEDAGLMVPVTKDEELFDVGTTEETNVHDIFSKLDIRQLHDGFTEIQSALYKPTVSESRNFGDTLSNVDSNDILRVMKIIPNRSDNEKAASLSKPFEIPEQKADSSLMEAIENILDTDVRKAFERDIPQTRHVPLDINIQEEALYAPLKDLSEYIVEEVPINGNYDVYKDSFKVDDKLSTVKTTEIVNKLVYVPVRENGKQSTDTPTTTTTKEEPVITTKEIKTEVTTTATTEEATTTTTEEEEEEEEEAPTTNVTKQIDGSGDEESITTTISNDFFNEGSQINAEVPTTENKIEELLKTSGEEILEPMEVFQRGLQEEETKMVNSTEENPNEIQEEVTENSDITNETNSDDLLSTTTPAAQIKEFFSEALSTVEAGELTHDSDDASQLLSETFDKIINVYFYPHPDTTTASPMPEVDQDLINRMETKLKETGKDADFKISRYPIADFDKKWPVNFIEETISTTTQPGGEDVVSEVVKADEETTEQHQIIKKPGVDDTSSDGDVEIKPIMAINVETNDLVATKTAKVESRSFGDDDEPVDPLRTLVEGVQLTAEITKTIERFPFLNDSDDSIHFAANQVIENKEDMALVKVNAELNSIKESVWCATARFIYISAGVLSIGLILSIVTILRFRQFERNIFFSC